MDSNNHRQAEFVRKDELLETDDVFKDAFEDFVSNPPPDRSATIGNPKYKATNISISKIKEISNFPEIPSGSTGSDLGDLVRDMRTIHAKRLNTVMMESADRDFPAVFLKTLEILTKQGLMEEKAEEDDGTVEVVIKRSSDKK